MNFDIPVREEIMILANAMTDEQRKAMFAKMGGGGGQKVYTRAESGGGGGGGGSGYNPPKTVLTTPNGTSGGGWHYTGAGEMTSSWVTSLSPDQMKEEFKNDPDRLRAAIEEQLRMGAYDGIMVNGHKPSVDDIINGNIAPNYTKPIEVKNLSERDFYAQKNDPMAGAEAVAIDPMTGKPMQEEQGSWAHLTPSQQVQEDMNGGTSQGSETTTSTAPTAGDYSVTPSMGDVAAAIDSLDLSGDLGEPSAAELSAVNIQAFYNALANVHF